MAKKEPMYQLMAQRGRGDARVRVMFTTCACCGSVNEAFEAERKFARAALADLRARMQRLGCKLVSKTTNSFVVTNFWGEKVKVWIEQVKA